MEASSVSNFLYNNLDYRAQNQKVISHNIANINTPGYKTKILSKGTFANELYKSLNRGYYVNEFNVNAPDRESLMLTNSKHILANDGCFGCNEFNVHYQDKNKLYNTNIKHFDSNGNTTLLIKAKIENRDFNNKFKVYSITGIPEDETGNNVDIDTQMAEMSKNKVLFDTIKSIIKKDEALFKSVIDASSKN